MVCFAQTALANWAMLALCRMTRANVMLTSAECRAQAELKIAEADRDERHQKRLIDAAQAWLLLASRLRRLEAIPYMVDAKTRSKKRAKG
jgi:hypothetical protein